MSLSVTVRCLVLLFLCKVGAQASQSTVADSLFATGNYSRAIEAYAQLGSLQAQLQIARSYKAIGNYTQAIEQYEHLAVQNPDMEIARYELGKLYLTDKKKNKALALWRELCSPGSVNPEYWYNLGLAQQGLLHTDEAMDAFRKAIRLDSTHLRSRAKMGHYFVMSKKLDSVLTYVDPGLAYYPDDVVLLNLKALAYYNNRQPWKAQPLFERLLELGVYREHIFEKLGNCYMAMAEYEKAIVQHKELLLFDAENSSALNSIGRSFWKLKELDSAKVYINKAIKAQFVMLDQEYATLARIAVEEEDLVLAIDYFKKSFKENPEGYVYLYEVCFLTDQQYKDPKMAQQCYADFNQKFGDKRGYFAQFVTKRLRELKEEIHFSGE